MLATLSTIFMSSCLVARGVQCLGFGALEVRVGEL